MKLAVINYNMGNLASVLNAIKRVGGEAIVESEPNNLKNYDKILLPGVGAFGDAMRSLRETGMDNAILEFAKTGKNIFGICLGLQLLFDESEEFGIHSGLGLIKGKVKRFQKSNLKVPHMGWNLLTQIGNHKSPIFKDLPTDFYLYFVHSYYVETEYKYKISNTNYGIEFTSAIQHENIFGLQPHPEKSHDNGLKILKNFIKL